MENVCWTQTNEKNCTSLKKSLEIAVRESANLIYLLVAQMWNENNVENASVCKWLHSKRSSSLNCAAVKANNMTKEKNWRDTNAG